MLTEQPVNRLLFTMTAPISLGMLSTFLFQIIDTFFVGKLGAAELAALAFASTVYFLFVGIFVGLSVGVSSVVARAAGAGDQAKTQLFSVVALWLTLLVSVGLSLLAFAGITPMFSALGADAAVMPPIRDYVGWLYLGLPLLMLGIVGSGIVRATGTIRLTEIIFALAGLVNLLFDYLLIFGIGPFPAMGMAGAAIASCLSFLFIFLGVIGVMVRKGLVGPRLLFRLGGGFAALRSIMAMALTTVGVQILVPATAILTTFLLAKFGADLVAAYGVASRIEALAMVGIFGVSSAMTPFVAQNFGAGKHARIDSAIIFAGKASVYMGLLVFVLLAIFGPAIASLFSSDPEIIAFVGLYFKIVAVSYGFFGIFNVTSAIFNGLQMPGWSLRLMLAKTFIFTAPLLIIAAFISMQAILAALAIGNVLAGIHAGILMRRSIRKWDRPIADINIWQDYKNDIKTALQWVMRRR